VAEQSSADYRGNLGRYALYGEIASGGMATVHLGRLIGSAGFARTVAIKRLHPHLAKDPDFVAMFLEEARVAARVRHPNVVATLDVVYEENELFLVMEYVAGESLSRLVRRAREAGKRIPPAHVAAMVCSALEGLHAAHEATSERGTPLGLVHRDVSPQNIHVGVDGVTRVLDFGIAKATNRAVETKSDQIKGKVAYMSPEQLAKSRIDRRADVYSASVVLWEALTGKRLFRADDVPALVYSIIHDPIAPPSLIVSELSKEVDAIVMKGLERDASKRWSSAREMAVALERALAPTPAREIGEWVRATAGEALASRVELVHRIESETSSSLSPILVKAAADVKSGVVQTAAVAEDDLDEDERETLLRADRASAPDLESAMESAPELDPASRVVRGVVIGALGVVVLLGIVLAIRLLAFREEPTESAPLSSATPAPESSDTAPIGLAVSRSAPSASAPPIARPLLAPVPKAANDCDDPFTVDAKGARHPKPYCFKR
jgi:eukaryotic-like serine/threonine-protein kinase